MSRAAIIADGVVVNLIVLADGADYRPGAGRRVVRMAEGETVDLGWSWNGTAFIAPPPPGPLEKERQRARETLSATREDVLEIVDELVRALDAANVLKRNQLPADIRDKVQRRLEARDKLR